MSCSHGDMEQEELEQLELDEEVQDKLELEEVEGEMRCKKKDLSLTNFTFNITCYIPTSNTTMASELVFRVKTLSGDVG